MRSRKERRKSEKQEKAYHFSVFLMYMMAMVIRINQVFGMTMLGEKLVDIVIMLLDLACLVLAFSEKKALEQAVLKIVISTALAEFLLFVTLHFETATSTGMAVRLILPCMFLYRLNSLNWIGRKTT
jgi:hypothetical protein